MLQASSYCRKKAMLLATFFSVFWMFSNLFLNFQKNQNANLFFQIGVRCECGMFGSVHIWYFLKQMSVYVVHMSLWSLIKIIDVEHYYWYNSVQCIFLWHFQSLWFLRNNCFSTSWQLYCLFLKYLYYFCSMQIIIKSKIEFLYKVKPEQFLVTKPTKIKLVLQFKVKNV